MEAWLEMFVWQCLLLGALRVMSALPATADIRQCAWDPLSASSGHQSYGFLGIG
jgi:hypothetical protein